MQRKTFTSQIKQVADRLISVTVSTAGVDRDNDTVDPAGWQLENFKRNPVVLFAHDYSALPVGRCPSISVMNGKLVASVEFPPSGMYPFADTVYDMVKAGFLNATSVGFKPLDSEPNDHGGVHFLQTELLEFSIVPIPSNPQALISTRSYQPATDAVRKWFSTTKETRDMRTVFTLKDDTVDDQTPEGRVGCPLEDQTGEVCPNNSGTADCPKGSDCPFRANSGAPKPPKHTNRLAIKLMADRETSRVRLAKQAELVRWERSKRIEAIRKGGGQVQMVRRTADLGGLLGADDEWPVGEPIVSLGIQ